MLPTSSTSGFPEAEISADATRLSQTRRSSRRVMQFVAVGTLAGLSEAKSIERRGFCYLATAQTVAEMATMRI